MLIYNYDTAGVLLGTTTLTDKDRDPLVANEYLIPGNATAVAPPAAQPGFARVWSNGAWGQVADNRGPAWDFDGKATTVKVLGALPAGLTKIKPPEAPAHYSLQFDDAMNGWQLIGDTAAAKKAAKAAVLAALNKVAELATSEYIGVEVNSWPTRSLEADAWLADNTAPAPLLRAVAEERDQSMADLVASIVQLRAQFYGLLAKLEGARKSCTAALESAQTVEQANSVKDAGLAAANAIAAGLA